MAAGDDERTRRGTALLAGRVDHEQEVMCGWSPVVLDEGARPRWLGVRRQAHRRGTARRRSRRRRAQPRPDAHRTPRRTSSGWSPTAPTPSSCAPPSTGATGTPCSTCPGFVMAAGGSDIEGLLDLLDGHVGHYVYVSSIMAYDQSLARRLPVDRGPADEPRRAGRATAGSRRSPRRRCWPATGERVPGDDRAPGGDLRARQQHLRHGAADVPAPARPSSDPGAPRRPGRRLVRARRRPVRGDGGDGRRTRPRSARCSTSAASRSPSTATSRCSPTSSARSPTSCTLPDSMLDDLPGPVFGHLFGVRHHAMASIEKARAAASVSRVASTCARATRTPTSGSGARATPTSTGPMVDPMWRASWDFDAEAAVAERVRGA